MVSRFGDFEDWIVAGLGVPRGDTLVVDVADTAHYPRRDRLGAVVVTGAQEMVTDGAPWMEAAGDWIRDLHAAGVPVLGICYGHQLLAHVFGGEVGSHPGGRELGSATVFCTVAAAADPIMSMLPPSFSAHESHSQAVLRLPEGAVVLAHNDHDTHQAFRIGATTWGVQFHPEFTEEYSSFLLERQRSELVAEGRDVDEMLGSVRGSEAGAILRAFAGLVGADRQ